MLTEAQRAMLEKAKTEKEAHGEFESEHPGYCGAQGRGVTIGVARLVNGSNVACLGEPASFNRGEDRVCNVRRARQKICDLGIS